MIDASFDLDDCCWTIGQIAKAIGSNTNTLNTWMHRELIKSYHDKKPNGFPTMFSTRAMIEFAIIQKLNKAGVSADIASEAASKFCHHANDYNPFDERTPGLSYKNDSTWLTLFVEAKKSFVVSGVSLPDAIHTQASHGECVRVINLDDLLERLWYHIKAKSLEIA